MASQQAYRVTTFVPPEALESVLEAVEREAEPLRFGDYERWAWWSAPGVEQFRPLEGAEPTVGNVGELERVPSVRLEFALPRDPALLERVLTRGLVPSHPWEEPVVFVDETSIP